MVGNQHNFSSGWNLEQTVPAFAATVASAADWHDSDFGELIKRAKRIARVNKINEIDIPWHQHQPFCIPT